MKVFITGIGGFIGASLAQRLLERGDQVSGIDNFDGNYSRTMKDAHLSLLGQASSLSVRVADCTDIEAVVAALRTECPDAVVHLAAKVGVRASASDPLGYTRTNVYGTAVVLEAVRRSGVPAFVYASSSSVYGNRSRGPFRELDATFEHGLNSHYAVTKLAGEYLVRAQCQLHGLRALSVRPFTVFGPWQRPDLVLHQFVRQITEGRPVSIFGSGKMARDFTFIDDVTGGILSGLNWLGTSDEGAAETVNLGRGCPITVTGLVEVLEAELGIEISREYFDRPEEDVSLTHACTEHARVLLGHRPLTSLRDGVRAFLDWHGKAKGKDWYP